MTIILVNIFTKVNSKYIYCANLHTVVDMLCLPTVSLEGRKMEYYQKRIRDLREDADKTQTEIAKMLGTSQTMYARYERGASELPIRHLIKLAQYYHVSSDSILGL